MAVLSKQYHLPSIISVHVYELICKADTYSYKYFGSYIYALDSRRGEREHQLLDVPAIEFLHESMSLYGIG